MNSTQQTASEFAGFIKGLGFKVYLAAVGTYGFITDATEARVLSFSFTDGGSLGGNYGPPSTTSGTGWRLDQSPWQLKTADDVRGALYATAPQWVGKGWKRYSTVADQLAQYGTSSKYREI